MTTEISITAKMYSSYGLCVLPADKETKRPTTVQWKAYQDRLPTESEWGEWGKTATGICILTGKISGNLLVIDFDDHGSCLTAWCQLIPEELRNRLVGVRTQSGGCHVYFRYNVDSTDLFLNRGGLIGNVKLALKEDGTDDKGKPKYKTLIETRGEGGLVIAPPTPDYEITCGSFDNIPVLQPVEVEILLNAARSFNQKPLQPTIQQPTAPSRPVVSPVISADMTEAKRRAIAYINAMPEAIQGNNGSAALLRVCNKLYEFGLDRNMAKQIIMEYYNPRCKPEWSEKEIDHKLDDAYNKPINEAGSMLDEPFVMTESMRNEVEELKRDMLDKPSKKNSIARTEPVDKSSANSDDKIGKSSDGKVIVPRLIDLSTIEIKEPEWLWKNKFHYGGLPLRGTVDDIRYFLDRRNVGINQADANGNTPLHVAVEHNPNVEVMRFFIAQGADVNVRNQAGWTPLDFAQLDEFKIILREAGAIPYQSHFQDIFDAAKNGTVQDVAYFVRNGVNVNTKMSDGKTPLYIAAENNSSLEIVRFLVFSGAFVDVKNDWGATPLYAAAEHNSNVEIVRFLVSHGADINAKNYGGSTPSHVAAWNNPNVEVVKHLVSYGADVNAKNDSGDTMLHQVAERNSNVEVLRYLVSVQGADINARNNAGQTPSDIANTDEKRAILREQSSTQPQRQFTRQEPNRIQSATDTQLTDEMRRDGWVSIFNGTTLDGWKENTPGSSGGFRVENGNIVGFGGKNHLYYMEEFKNFELKIDVKINQGGNSGVYVKSQWQEAAYPNSGFELQVNLSQQEPQKTGSLYGIIPLSEAPHDADEWFTYHIICNGNRIDVFLDGKLLYYYVDPGQGNPLPITEQTKRINQSGYIALQQHDPGSVVEFRNIHVKKLPD